MIPDEHITNKIDIRQFITVVRDVRDSSISSFFRFIYQKSINPIREIRTEVIKLGLGYFLKSMHENVMLYEKSLITNPYVFRYEKYKMDPICETKRLLNHLNMDIHDDAFIMQVVDLTENYVHDENLPINLTDYKKRVVLRESKLDYLLTKDHNTSDGQTQKWKDFFTEEQKRIILCEPILRDFFLENGYDLL